MNGNKQLSLFGSNYNVVKRNRFGHLWIEEPVERIKFREGCKHNRLLTLCKKGYLCYEKDGALIGCTPNVSCPRLRSWDTRHGLQRPFTMVENEQYELERMQRYFDSLTPEQQQTVVSIDTLRWGRMNQKMPSNAEKNRNGSSLDGMKQK